MDQQLDAEGDVVAFRLREQKPQYQSGSFGLHCAQATEDEQSRA
jgi:hypothetical protein